MTAPKFYIWGGGRWRELSPSGRVAGWREARFVAVSRGRLVRCRRGPVLQGLRALAAGRPTSVHDGPPVLQIRPKASKKEEPLHHYGHSRCCWHHAHSAAVSAPAPAQFQTISSRCEHCPHCRPSALHAPAAGVLLQKKPEVSTVEKESVSAPMLHATDATDFPHAQKKSDRDRLREQKGPGLMQYQTQNYTTLKRKRSISRELVKPAKQVNAGESDPEVYWQLAISEEDVLLLRRYIELHDKTPFPTDLLRFDEDDVYKQSVFLRLNPIVDVGRSRRIERMIRERRSRTRVRSPVSLKDFAHVLGLQSLEERSSQDTNNYRTRNKTLLKRKRAERRYRFLTSDTGEEGASEPRAKLLQTPKVGKKDVDMAKMNGITRTNEKRKQLRKDNVTENGRVVSQQKQRTSVLPSEKDGMKNTDKVVSLTTQNTAEEAPTAKRGGAREYSMLEDAAIVRWVSGGDRGRLVKGNRLWRELQPLHHQRTGQFRSWHSLRNRYLRSLLPRLGLHVSAADATRLRVAAATGELKSRKTRNSIFDEARVRSAWALKPRCMPRRYRASSSESSPATGSDSAVPPSSKRARETERFGADGANHSLNKKAGTSPQRLRTPTYSEVTRRFVSRRVQSSGRSHSSSPSRTPPTPKTHRATRSRTRLYNPKVLA